MLKRIAFLFVFSGILLHPTFAQKQVQARIDSLLTVLSKSKEDTNKVKTLINLSEAYGYYLYKKEITDTLPLQYLNQGLIIAKKINNKKSQADCYASIANVYGLEGNNDKQLENYLAENKIAKESGDKKRIATSYSRVGNIYASIGNHDKALEMFLASLKIREELGDKKSIARCYTSVGMVYGNKQNTLKSLESYLASLKIYNEIADKDGIANSYTSLGYIYSREGNYEKALETYFSAVKIYQEKGNKSIIARIYTSIGDVYEKQKNYNKELEIYYAASKICEETGDKSRVAEMYDRVGWFYMENQHNYEKALESFLAAFKLYKESGDKQNIANCYDNLGTVYSRLKNNDKALENELASLKIYKELGDKHSLAVEYYSIGNNYETDGNYDKALENYLAENKIAEEKGDIAFSHKNIARIYLKQNKLKEAKEQSLLYLNIAKEIDSKSDIKDSYQNLSKCDSALAEWKGAYEYHKLYKEFSDSVDNVESIKKAAAITSKYESEKNDEQIKLKETEQEKKDALAKSELKQQTFQRNAFIGGFALMILLAGVSYRNFRRKKKDNLVITEQKNIVETQNKEIKDSIQYALRIQTAILPPQKIVKQYLENSFILYKPKDIVAGDFYWMETVNDLVLFAACDCTGHGVPGAMVSVVCHNALNRAVREFGLTQPAAILDKTAEIVIENFSKSEEDIKDGMDISLCSLNIKTMELQWAGANNPFWIMRSTQLLEETKADKQPIGMNEDSTPFTNHTFTLNSGDTLYLFTDGFADQFGGDTGEKKLTRKRFKEVLQHIQNKSMDEQGVALDKFINEYRKEVEQIDDILVMGVRV